MSSHNGRLQTAPLTTGSGLADKFELNLPEYEGTDEVVELPPSK